MKRWPDSRDSVIVKPLHHHARKVWIESDFLDTEARTQLANVSLRHFRFYDWPADRHEIADS